MELSNLQTLPPPPANEIIRSNLIDGLLYQIDQNDVLIVNGLPQVGKTTFLAQFHRRHVHNCISIFIRGTSALGYDYEFIADEMTSQAITLASNIGTPKAISDDTPSNRLKSALLNLHKLATNRNLRIHFILDGLDEIPDDESSAAQALFALLPLGMTQFRAIISGTRARDIIRNRSGTRFSEYTIVGFTEEESIKHLKDIVSEKEALDLHAISRGIPGYYAAARRTIATHGNMPNPPPPNIEKFCEFEWEKIKNKDLPEQVIAILCFDKRVHTTESLSFLLGTDLNSINEVIASASFLVKEEKTIQFAVESFRQFAERRLIHRKQSTLTRLIEHFSNHSMSNESIRHLPDLLSQTGRYDDLVSYLNDDYIVAALRNRHAARFIQERALLGFHAANKRDLPEDVLRFGLQCSNLDKLYFDEQWISRIEAFLSVGELSTAIELAHQTSSIEDRIQSLCAIIRHQRLNKLSIDPEILAEIEEEYRHLDKEHLGARAYEIAADLALTHPHLAFDLMQYATEEGADQQRRDFAVARLTLGMQHAQETTDDEVERLHQRISDPTIRSFTRALHSVAQDQHPSQVLAVVKNMSSDQERSLFLRQWLEENRSHAGRLAIIKYALDFSIKSTEVNPSPSFFLSVAKCLVGLPGAEEPFRIIDGQLTRLQQTGPTITYFRLSLCLVEIELSRNHKIAWQRFQEIDSNINAIEDLSIRATLIAEELSMLNKLRKKADEFAQKQVRDRLNLKLDELVNSILAQTADHFKVLRPCLIVLSRFDLSRSIKIAESLNTEPRRDAAKSSVLFNALVHRRRSADIGSHTGTFQSIASDHTRTRTLLLILRSLSTEEKNEHAIRGIAHFRSWIETINSPVLSTIALAYFAVSLVRLESKSLGDILWIYTDIDLRLSSIDPSLEKLVCYYSLCFILADIDSSRARIYLKEGEAKLSTTFIKTTASLTCLVLNLKTTLRSFSGLIPKRSYTDTDRDEIISLISKLPGISDQVDLLTDFAVRLHLGGAHDECRAIVNRHLQPLLANSTNYSEHLFRLLTRDAAPALYCASAISCLAALESLDVHNREGALIKVLDFLISRLPQDEPYLELDLFATSLDTDRAYEIIRLLEMALEDSTVVNYLRIITDYATDSKTRVTRNEQHELARRIEALVSSKLPSSRFKMHEGYKIVGDAFVLALLFKSWESWSLLLERTRKLPNLSDRVFVTVTISDLLRGKNTKHQGPLLKEALSLAEKIPVSTDRGQRLLMIAESARKVDTTIFKKCVDLVLTGTGKKDHDHESSELRKRAVDITYQYDPDLANTLVEKFDSDPARQSAKSLQARIDMLKYHKLIADCSIGDHKFKDPQIIPDAYSRALSSLNSGLLNPLSLKHLCATFGAMKGYDTDDAYPVVSFGIESCVRRYKHTNEAFGILKKIFRVSLSSTRIVVQCIGDRSTIGSTYPSVDRSTTNNSIIVRKGEKQAAIDFVLQWLNKQSPRTIYISDPYFTESDLEAISCIRSVSKEAAVVVLTSRSEIAKRFTEERIKPAFQNAWRVEFPLIEPGVVHICVVGLQDSGISPIHDRWWICEKEGLRLGGSWNGIGKEKEMELSIIPEPDLQDKRSEIERFALFMEPFHNGRRLEYFRFSL